MYTTITKLIFLASIACTTTLRAQSQSAPLSGEQLYKTIVALDSVLFKAFNECDIQTFRRLFTDDLEFYHDKGGLTLSLASFMKDFENGLCNKNNKWRSRRELVPGSLKVFPLNNYGAILTGEHRFYERGPDGKEVLRSTARFTHVFREKEGVWKIARALSYDHQAAQ